MLRSVYDVLVGDLLYLEAGDVVPADGVLVSGYSVKCDEASITGESDQKRKIPGEAASQIEAEANLDQLDPFIISGSKVLEGTGTYLITGVGIQSSYGKLIVSMADDDEVATTPLQAKLNIVAEQITHLGCSVAFVLFIALFIRFLVQLKSDGGTPTSRAQNFLEIMIVAVTVIVIAVPEGLPLAVTLALGFAMIRMLKDKCLVRVLSSCETMGNATAICSDKTGTLTMNKMTVIAGILGTTCQFGLQNEALNEDPLATTQVNPRGALSVPCSGLSSLLSREVKDLLLQSIASNSTAFEGEDDGNHTFVGSKTETAMLSFAKAHLGMCPVNEERANANIIRMFPFDSRRKSMAVIVKLSDSTYRMYVKGASEILLEKCTHTIAGLELATTMKTVDITTHDRDALINTFNGYAKKSLRTIGIAYRDFRSDSGYKVTSDNSLLDTAFEDIFEQMVFVAVVGIQDPLRPGVKEAVTRCQHAGVAVRMVTGDSVWTATAVAQECGIYTGGTVLEGPDFRKLSSDEMERVLPRLQVLARSSPEDKRILVKKLRELGETVAVTGDGTNDGPALKAADVGFSMGISGTEIAREASSIILIDDDFSSITKALEWGRTVNDAVRKFLQVRVWLLGSSVFLPNLSLSLVPAYRKYHRSWRYFRVRNSRPPRRTDPDASSVTLGEPYHGHLCCPRIGYGPACSEYHG